MKKILSNIIILTAAALMLSGCTSIYNSDKITVIKQRVFGLVYETSSTSANGTPSIKLGFVSSVVQIIPTSTNQIYAPSYYDSFNLGQSLNPFSTDISEDTAIGHVSVGTNKDIMLGARLRPLKVNTNSVSK